MQAESIFIVKLVKRGVNEDQDRTVSTKTVAALVAAPTCTKQIS